MFIGKMRAIVVAVGVLCLGLASSAHADLVTNGGFEVSGGPGQLGFNTSATGWAAASGSYNFLFAPGTADTIGALGQDGIVALWGPGDGSNNGLPAVSPDGGNFLALDSNFQVGAVSQTINGLTAGNTYTVGFWWAAAQQVNFNGGTASQFNVGFGSQTQTTPLESIGSGGFSGWMYQTFNFTADNTSDVLSFLASGLPVNGAPPFALLDGVSVVATTPLPSTLSSASVLGILGLAAYRMRRGTGSSAASALVAD